MALKYFNVLSGISAGNITINAANNTVVANEFVGNVTGTILTSSQPNITDVGTLSNLNVSGNASFTGENVSLGDVANLKMSGGTTGQVLTTDGVGNLSFTTPSTAQGGNIYVFTRSSGTVYIEVELGSIVIVSRSGNISIPVQA